ncbi:MAG: hypothetical protein ACOCWO_03085 [Candidatus Muiribacteriaceae bacterium]
MNRKNLILIGVLFLLILAAFYIREKDLRDRTLFYTEEDFLCTVNIDGIELSLDSAEGMVLENKIVSSDVVSDFFRIFRNAPVIRELSDSGKDDFFTESPLFTVRLKEEEYIFTGLNPHNSGVYVTRGEKVFLTDLSLYDSVRELKELYNKHNTGGRR